VIVFSTDTLEVEKKVDMKAEACVACHSEKDGMHIKESSEMTRTFRKSDGTNVFGKITPIRNEPSCYNAECHAHPPTQTILGVLDVMMSLSEFDASLLRLQNAQYMSNLLLALIVTLCAGVFLWFGVRRPVKKLTVGTSEIMKGNLDYRINVRTNDEIGVLANSFNNMSEELKRAHNELTQWAQTLEQRVEEKTKELKRAQAGIVHIEKMASLGKLAATVAHEINNPLEGILNYAKLLRKKLKPGEISEDDANEINEELTIIANETARCGTIVKNLLLFSRQPVGDFAQEDLRSLIDLSLKLIDHHLKMNEIKLETDLSKEPLNLFCNAQQIQQLLLAIEINAVEAMHGGGTLRISAGKDFQAGRLSVKISDTGMGIPEQDLPHIFEPFFTTKKNEKATGLGLAVAYGIAERHGGSISVFSEVNKGTTFTIILPQSSGAQSHQEKKV
jgi:two-component system NtrC family sensor kinase